jgi:hypothetical protein
MAALRKPMARKPSPSNKASITRSNLIVGRRKPGSSATGNPQLGHCLFQAFAEIRFFGSR